MIQMSGERLQDHWSSGLSDMTGNEKRKEGDYLMTCFVIHVSLLSYTLFLETAVLQKSLSFTTHLQI